MCCFAIHLQYELVNARLNSSDEYLEVRAKIICRHLHDFRCARWRASRCATSQCAYNMGLPVLESSRGTIILKFVQNNFSPFARFSVRTVACFSVRHVAICLISSKKNHHLHAFRCALWHASRCAPSQSACNMSSQVLGSSRGTSILNSE